MPRLENWSIITNSKNPFFAPELQSRSLHGNVYGHPNFNDGDPVSTSTLKEFDYKNRVAKTRNTEYELGKISEEYQKCLEENNINLED